MKLELILQYHALIKAEQERRGKLLSLIDMGVVIKKNSKITVIEIINQLISMELVETIPFGNKNKYRMV